MFFQDNLMLKILSRPALHSNPIWTPSWATHSGETCSGMWLDWMILQRCLPSPTTQRFLWINHSDVSSDKCLKEIAKKNPRGSPVVSTACCGYPAHSRPQGWRCLTVVFPALGFILFSAATALHICQILYRGVCPGASCAERPGLPHATHSQLQPPRCRACSGCSRGQRRDSPVGGEVPPFFFFF